MATLIGNIRQLVEDAVGSAGITGATGPVNTVTVSNNNDGTYTWDFDDGGSFTTGDLTGPAGAAGAAGADGKGVSNIGLDSSSGLTDTYKIEYTDGTSDTYDVNNGAEGAAGVNGDSAYEVAVDEGFSGSRGDWVASLNGTNGVDGTNGADGVDGDSAYAIAVAEGYSGSQTDWVASLIGADGVDGIDGTGVTIDSVANNTDGTMTIEFSDGTSHTTQDLRGQDGTAGSVGADGPQGVGVTAVRQTQIGGPSEMNKYEIEFDDGNIQTCEFRNGDSVYEIEATDVQEWTGYKNTYTVKLSNGTSWPIYTWNGGQAQADFAFSASGSPLEAYKGQEITDPEISWDINETPDTIKVDGTAVALSDNPYTLEVTITANDDISVNYEMQDGRTGGASVGFRFYNKYYAGVSDLESLEDADVRGLNVQGKATGDALSTAFDCSGGKYFYYAYPSAFDALNNTKVNNNTYNDFEIVTRDVENAYGVTEEYRIYRSGSTMNGDNIPVEFN